MTLNPPTPEQQPTAQVPSDPTTAKQPAQDPAVQKPVQQRSTRSLQKPTKQERSPALNASTKSVNAAAAKATYDYRPRYEPDYAGGQHPEGYGMERPYKEVPFPWDKEISSSWEHNKPMGMYGGEAIIITAAITSFTGLGKTFEYQHSMLEYVVDFNGKPLTNAQYEALPYDVPHIKPGGYKLVLVGEKGHY
jgi:hypothetical protein